MDEVLAVSGLIQPHTKGQIMGCAFKQLSVFLIMLAGTDVSRGQGLGSGGKPVLYYIPHTHWEGAVFKTREGYLEEGLPHITEALRLLKKYPEYKFTLDQVAYVRPFLERYPEEETAFRQFMREGRLEVVGGMDVMPDDVKPGGELFVRQMQYGKWYCREKLGVDVTTGWFLDTFGHHPQMPQLLKLGGYSSFWFCRGVPSHRLPSEFRWRGIDGSDITAFWLPGFYGLFYGPPRSAAGFAKFFEQRYDSLNPYAKGEARVGLAGVDVCEPEEHVPPLMEQFNREAGRRFRIHCAVPSEFEKVVAKRPDLPVVRGDFNPIFQGTYSSRIELKQRTRELEARLLSAEKVSVLADWLGGRPADSFIWKAWEPVLFNQTHDLASGVMTDIVYEDTVRNYDFSEKLANDILERRWEEISERIDTAGDGVPVVVFNPLGWARSDVAEAQVSFTGVGIRDYDVIDDAGERVPAQSVEARSYSDGSLMMVRIVFVARDIPALGYATYHVIPRKELDQSKTATQEAGSERMENERYRLKFNLATGELLSLFDKADGWEVLRGPGNVVAREQDRGDLWELYRGLDGASHIAMTNKQSTPVEGRAQLSSAFRGTNGMVRRGPVFSEFTVSHAFTNGSFGSNVRIFNGLRRVEFETELVNHEKYVRYQVLFPSAIEKGSMVQEIPFGAVERPIGVEYPAQNWVDYSDGRKGLALLNIGLPGNVVTEDGTLMISLMRSHNLGAYGYGGGYEPGMTSETGFELGKRRVFHYAAVPHTGSWNDAAIFRDGMEFNHPLIAHKVRAHPGLLPKRWGLLGISASNVVLTAVSPSREGNMSMSVRLYEAGGKASTHAMLRVHAPLRSAEETNLMEDSIARLEVRGDGVEMDFHPFEIKTVKVRLGEGVRP